MGSIKVVIMQYGRAMWRRRWYAIAVAWAISAIGWMVVSRMPDVYESKARVYMNSDEALTPLLRGITVDSDVDNRLERMQRTLLSVPHMKKLIRMTDLQDQVKDAADTERMVAELQNTATGIVIKPETRNLFRVSYRNSNPQLAQSVVSNVLSIFMEDSAGDSRTDIDSAQRFLQTQIDAYETQMREAERKKAEFQTRYYELLSNDTGGSHLTEARTTVQKTTEELNDAIARHDNLQKSLEALPRYEPSRSGVNAPALNSTTDGLSVAPDVRLAQLNTQLETELSTKTEEHPDVKKLQNQIASLTALLDKKKADTPAPKKATSATPAASAATQQNVENPLYRDMAIKLVDEETNIASLRRRLASAEDDRDKLEDEARRAPSVNADYLNLSRDYDVIKNNYEQLLQRKESAHIAEEADKKGDKVDLKTIDPPDVPIVPVAPQRLIYFSLVLVAGLGAGLSVAFLLSQIDSSYGTTTALQALGLPILGSISVVSAFERRRQYWFAGAKGFAAALVMLVFVYGGLMIVFIGRQHAPI